MFDTSSWFIVLKQRIDELKKINESMKKQSSWKEEDDDLKISGQIEEMQIYLKKMPKVSRSYQ